MSSHVDPKRSALMGRIRGKDTEPEVLLRKALWRRGLRYRKNARAPVGRPDIVIASRKLAIFIDGCFWHGCPEHYVRPRSREEFWAAKLRENVERDRRQVAQLEALGWRVFRVWEHEVFESIDVIAAAIAAGVNGVAMGRRASWRLFQVDPLDEAGTRERRNLTELRGLDLDQTVEQARHTRKWARPSRSR